MVSGVIQSISLDIVRHRRFESFDHLQHSLLAIAGERKFHIFLSQRFAEIVVDGIDTAFPSWTQLFGSD